MPTRRKTTSASRGLPETVPMPTSVAGHSSAVLVENLAGDYIQGSFYSDILMGADPGTLDKVRRVKLLDEIVLLRVVMRRVVQQAIGQDLTLDAWLNTPNSLSQAATRLARLLTLEQTLAESEDNDLALLAQAINEVMKEQGW